ncbi:hypothetical protein LSAT2_003953 [Lamellibrachia satsuma]|nr:hypothetical protein LSAT2_003953 [Lamellibrachia satsuma]
MIMLSLTVTLAKHNTKKTFGMFGPFIQRPVIAHGDVRQRPTTARWRTVKQTRVKISCKDRPYSLSTIGSRQYGTNTRGRGLTLRATTTRSCTSVVMTTTYTCRLDVIALVGVSPTV